MLRDVVNDRLDDAELLLDKWGALRFVAPLPARRLFNKDGLLAQMKAWNEETVNTPNRFKIPFVMGVTCVSTPYNLYVAYQITSIDLDDIFWIILNVVVG